MITKQIGNKSESKEKQIRGILKEKCFSNRDGFFFQNSGDIIRTLDSKIACSAIDTAVLNGLMCHFRMASAGKITQDNVHGWVEGDWTFFHNGGVSTYVNSGVAREQELTDSYQLFQDILRAMEGKKGYKDKVVCRILEEVLKNVNFWGRAALYNNKTDSMYLFGDFWVYQFASSYLILSSSSLFSLSKDYTVDTHGIKVKYESSIGESKIDGIGVINHFSTPDFKYKNLAEKFETKSRTYDNFPVSKGFEMDSKFWEKKNGVWVRKVQSIQLLPESNTPGLPKIIVPTNAEHEEILENMKKAMDQDEEMDYSGVDDCYTEQELENLYADPAFVGWDKRGQEMWRDMFAIHDSFNSCCIDNSCLDLTDINDLVLKEEVMSEEQLQRLHGQKIGFKV